MQTGQLCVGPLKKNKTYIATHDKLYTVHVDFFVEFFPSGGHRLHSLQWRPQEQLLIALHQPVPAQRVPEGSDRRRGDLPGLRQVRHSFVSPVNALPLSVGAAECFLRAILVDTRALKRATQSEPRQRDCNGDHRALNSRDNPAGYYISARWVVKDLMEYHC